MVTRTRVMRKMAWLDISSGEEQDPEDQEDLDKAIATPIGKASLRQTGVG